MNKILAGKARERKRLTALPFSEKVAILEKLRDRSLLIAKSPLRKIVAPKSGTDSSVKNY